jgi:predicted O-linked N-acetylglucosamine transferase (SPINDLY family)
MGFRDLFRFKRVAAPLREAPQAGRESGASASPAVAQLLREAQGLHLEGRLAEAASAFRAVLDLDSQSWPSLNALASIALQAGDLEEAIRRYDALVVRQPDFAEGYYKRGNANNRLRRWAAALADYDRAIAVDSGHANAFCNRGTVLEQLGRKEEALASYDRTLALNSTDAFAFYNRAGVLRELNRVDEAIESYDRAIELNSSYIQAYVNRGHLLQRVRRLEEAAASYGRAIELCPIVIGQDGRPTGLRPEQKYLLGLRRHALMHVCDWRDMEADLARIADGLGVGLPVSLPLPVLAMLDAPSLHRAAAASWIREESPPDAALGPLPPWPRTERIRVGYFSADFRMHPVAHLTAGLFERHDRSRFEVTAFAFGPETNDAMVARLGKAFDRFVDVRQRSDLEVATLARDLRIDIAVDLNGITEYCRSRIFALRAAPIQVGFLGYPGTTGAGFMDYLIADGMVVPRAQQTHYSEKIVYLPGSFLPFDSSYAIAERAFTRAELRLPSKGVVFCCFNNSYKIVPAVFDRWMRILGRTEGSVLWLQQANALMSSNLRKEALRRGIDGGRLIFADRMPSLAEHVARLRVADLFLDTFPYNAHATALDALWAGVPLLTCPGDSFASRVAASLLHTVGLPELIAGSGSEYEQRAVELASDPARLGELRRMLAQRSAPLFDTERYTRNLEAAYEAIHERGQSGLAPAHLNEHLAV